MRLVHDADNIVSLDLTNNISDMARSFAADVDAGEWGAVSRVVVLVENDGGIVTLGWGEGCTAYELMGLFEAAKLKAFAEDFADD